jgi:hypothetical protein
MDTSRRVSFILEVGSICETARNGDFLERVMERVLERILGMVIKGFDKVEDWYRKSMIGKSIQLDLCGPQILSFVVGRCPVLWSLLIRGLCQKTVF